MSNEKVIEHKTEIETIVNLDNFVIKDGDGDGYSMVDIINEAIDFSSELAKVELKGVTFSHHMVLMADLAGNPATFRALCTVAEERLRVGRPIKGTPKAEKLLWQPMPLAYGQYKSRILAALEAGIKPMAVVDRVRKLAKPDQDGNTTKVDKVKLDSVAKMDKERRIVEERTASHKKQPKAGVKVNHNGDMHTKAVEPASNTNESTPESIQTDDVKLEAGIVDPRLAALLSRLIEGYQYADEDTQEKVRRSLTRLTSKLWGTSEEVKAKAKATA